MAGVEDEPGGELGVMHLADPHSERMKQIYGHLFDVCSELVEVGLMDPTELQTRMHAAQEQPGLLQAYLTELDPSAA